MENLNIHLPVGGLANGIHHQREIETDVLTLKANNCFKLKKNKTKVICADFIDFDFEDKIIIGNISVLMTNQLW